MGYLVPQHTCPINPDTYVILTIDGQSPPSDLLRFRVIHWDSLAHWCHGVLSPDMYGVLQVDETGPIM